MAPLKIGILGAARIADDGIVDPTRALGHRLIAVAARDRSRAEAFAHERGIERVHENYADVIDDPDVDLVYNALVNSLHAKWNQYALEAGKHVLSEKPFASNASEALLVREVARRSPGQVVEGFHYLHHPVNLRLRELVRSGALGEIQQVDIELRIPAPPDRDPRWSLDLAGGATMDLGCYVLNAARQVGRWLDERPSVITAEAILKEPDVDAAMRVELAYPSGIRAQLNWDMNAQDRTMTWTVSGTRGSAVVPAFAVPHMDNRIMITRDGSTEVQILGDQTSYTYQLAALAEALQTGAEFLIDVDDSVANAELIDDVYRTAGIPVRGQHLSSGQRSAHDDWNRSDRSGHGGPGACRRLPNCADALPVHLAGPAVCLHRRRQSRARLARGPALWIRAQRHFLAGDRGGPQRQCRQRGRG
jgi:predicted dehydrogenase